MAPDDVTRPMQPMTDSCGTRWRIVIRFGIAPERLERRSALGRCRPAALTPAAEWFTDRSLQAEPEEAHGMSRRRHDWLGISERRWTKAPDEEVRPAKTLW